MTLPVVTGRKYFSATVMNEFSRSLLTSYSWAIAPRAAFAGLLAASSGTNIWTGYILYTGDTDTFRYRLNHGSSGSSTIKIGGSTAGVVAGTGVQAGTLDVSSLPLVSDTVYSVTLDSTVSCDPQWLGFSKTINYTAPPTFSASAVLAASSLNTLRTSLSELEDAWGMPHTPNVMGRRGKPGHHEGYQMDGTAVSVWRGWFYHSGDALRYRFRHGIDGKTLSITILYNSASLVVINSTSHDTVTSGSVALPSLTLGNIYEAEVRMTRTGTSNDMRGFCWVYEVAEFGSGSVTPPPVWGHGGSNITHTNLNRYATIINAIHPGAPSPVYPLYFEQPALKTDTTGYRYYMQHRRKWLRYRVRSDVSNKTVEIEYGPNLGYTHALESSAGNHSFDLTTIPKGLGIGSWFNVEDAEFACEFDSAQP